MKANDGIGYYGKINRGSGQSVPASLVSSLAGGISDFRRKTRDDG